MTIVPQLAPRPGMPIQFGLAPWATGVDFYRENIDACLVANRDGGVAALLVQEYDLSGETGAVTVDIGDLVLTVQMADRAFDIDVDHPVIPPITDANFIEVAAAQSAVDEVLAARAAVAPAADADSVLLAEYSQPAWAQIKQIDDGCIYFERWYDRPGLHLVLSQTDEWFLEDDGRVTISRTRPLFHFDGQVLDVDEARAMVCRSADSDRDDSPLVEGLVELLFALEGSLR